MAEAVFEGRPIWIERVITRTRIEHGFHLAAFVGRPVQLGGYMRHNTSGVGPELSTGNASQSDRDSTPCCGGLLFGIECQLVGPSCERPW